MAVKKPIPHDPGGKIRRPLKDGVKGTDKFSENKKYRYRLSRTWDANKPHALFVLMNPSTADRFYDDPTVAKCQVFAKGWEVYGGIYVGNTFAFVATKQKDLIGKSDAVGRNNNNHLIAMAKQADIVIFAYGKPHKTLRQRGLDVARLVVEKAQKTPHILRLTKDGCPRHPLYLPKTDKPRVWRELRFFNS
jgi:hypothetical protein